MDVTQIIVDTIGDTIGFAATRKAFEKSSSFTGFLSYRAYYVIKYFIILFALLMTGGLIYYYIFVKPKQERFEDKPMFKHQVSTST